MHLDKCFSPRWIQRMARKSTIRTAARHTTAIVLCAFVFFLSVVAASPALHKAIHHDADSPGHECVITVFAGGHVAAPGFAPVAVILGALFAWVALRAESLPFSTTDYCFSQSRAPPRGSSVL